jgi:two-component system cell cycle response regulator DivK
MAGMAKRILVVEDNDLNRKLFCDVLKSQALPWSRWPTGCRRWKGARDFVPNLIIMDIQLPNISGLDLIEAANDPVLRTIPVLAVTAYAGKGDEERIRQAGAEGYLAKPVSIGPFMAAVKRLIDGGLDFGHPRRFCAAILVQWAKASFSGTFNHDRESTAEKIATLIAPSTRRCGRPTPPPLPATWNSTA